MALTDGMKRTLIYHVKKHIADGHDLLTAIFAIEKYGFKRATITKYYKAFSK